MKSNKIIIFLLIFLNAINSGCTHDSEPSDNYKEDDIKFTYAVEDGEAILQSVVSKDIEEVFIPSEVQIDGLTYPVTTIASKAFAQCEGLSKLHLPSTITRMEVWAFSYTDIKELYIENLESWCNINFCMEIDYEPMPDGPSISEYGNPNPINENTILYVNGEKIEDTLIIPSGVKKISAYAFNYFNFKELILSPGVETLGKRSFGGCDSLEKIKVPSSLKNINEGALSYSNTGRCIYIPSIEDWLNIKISWNYGNYTLYVDEKPLIDIEIPNSVTTIPSRAFEGCLAKTFKFHPGVEIIENNAFYDTPSLVTITGMESVKEIGSSAFYYSGIENINLGDNLETIGSNAFYSCKMLKSIIIPGSVDTVPKEAFASCQNLQYVQIDEGCSMIDDEAFSFCYNLKEVVLPTSLRRVCFFSFSNCEALQEFVFPEGVTNIECDCLDFCTELTKVTLPSTLTYFDCEFLYCDNLKTIIMNSPVIPESPNYFKFNYKPVWENCTLYVPEQSLKLYKENPIWGKFKNIQKISMAE